MKKINSIILAAGKSSRMGFDKALVLIKKKSNIINIACALESVSNKVVAVASDNYQKIEDTIAKSDCQKTVVIKNNKAELGMFSSIKAGISAISKEDVYVFLQPVDTFGVPLSVHKKLLENLDDEHAFFKPYYEFENGQKRGGHPIIISPKGILMIKKALISDNLRNIMKNVKYIKTDRIEILNSINTPSDLKRIKEG